VKKSVDKHEKIPFLGGFIEAQSGQPRAEEANHRGLACFQPLL
jgi:hypothetical protein